jgi:hypothetical protein
MADAFEPRFADLVRIFTTTQGTDHFIVGAAVTGFRSFHSAIEIGDQFYYCAQHSDRPSEHEIGRGTLRADGKIARDPIGGVFTSFSPGAKTVALVAAAEWYETMKLSLDAAAAEAGAAATSASQAAASVADISAVLSFTAPSDDAVARPFGSKLGDVVSAKDFGCIGDGVANDMAALRMAFQYAAESGVPLHIPAGTDLVDRGVGSMTAIPSGRFVVHGDGAATVIKMRDGQIVSDFVKIFSFQPTSDVEFIEIGNLVLDMNARGSPPPAGDFDYQHCHAIAVEPQGTVKVGHCRFPGLIIKDPAADGINIAPAATATVDTVQINDILEIDRTRVRASIECSRLPNSLIVTGAKCHRIECETISPSATPKKILLANCDVEILDLLEDGAASPTLIEANLVNVTTTDTAQLSNLRVNASNCVLRQNGGVFYYLHKSHFRGCTFLHAYDGGTNAISSLNPFWRSANADVGIDFSDCDFLIDSDDAAIAPTGYLIRPSHVTDAADVRKSRLSFSNCRFDPRAQGSVFCHRNGSWRINGCTLAGKQAAIFYGTSALKAVDVAVNGGDFGSVGGAAVRGQWMSVDQNTTIAFLRMTGDWIGVATPAATDSGAIADAGNQMINDRRMAMPTLPASGVIGDVVKLQQPVEGSPDEYRCTVSSGTAATWRMTRQAGVKKGSSATRPALSARDAGTRYFDTTLAAAGKPITWTGTAWVDAAGTAA